MGRICLDKLINILDALKYTNRLSYTEFVALLFPDSPDEHYNLDKWLLFNNDRMGFLWSCSNDKLALLCQYVNETIYGDSQNRTRWGNEE